MDKKISCLAIALMLMFSTAYAQPANPPLTSNTILFSTQVTPMVQPTSGVTNLVASGGSYVTTNPPFLVMKHYRIIGQGLQNPRLILDGKDVTNFAVIADKQVSYSPPKPFDLGNHLVELVGGSSFGFPYDQRMTFTIIAMGPTTNLTGAVSDPSLTAATGLPAWNSQVTTAVIPGFPLASYPSATDQTVTTQTTTTPGDVMGAPSMITTTTTTTTSPWALVPVDVAFSSLSTIKIVDNLMRPAHSNDFVPVTLLGRPSGVATFDVVPLNQTNPSQTQIITNGTTQTTTIYSPPTSTITTVAPGTVVMSPNGSAVVYSTNKNVITETSPATVTTTTYVPTSSDLGIKMTELSPGMYAATYHVTDPAFFNNAMLVGHLSLPDGENLIGSSATINSLPAYAAYVGSPLYATVWVPNVLALEQYSSISQVQGAPSFTTTIPTTTTTTTMTSMTKPRHHSSRHKMGQKKPTKY